MDLDPISDSALVASPSWVMQYARQSDVIAFFEPYFSREIVPPGATNNSVYRQHIKKVADMQAKAKELLNQKFQYGFTPADLVYGLVRNAGGKENLEQCVWTPIPYYSLTFNSVLYKGETNMTSFFTLDTTRMEYLLTKDKKLIGTIGLTNLQSRYYLYINFIDPIFAIDYQQIIGSGKQPILVNSQLTSLDGRYSSPPITNWAYMDKGQLILQQCKYESGKNSPIVCKTLPVEQYLISSNTFFSVLEQRIENAYDDLVQQEHVPPIKPYYTGTEKK